MVGAVTEVVYWMVVFSSMAGLLFFVVYSLILFVDLTHDQINPIELCERVNELFWPEFFLHCGVALMLAGRGFYLGFIGNLPLIVYHIQRIVGSQHMLDNTRIFSQVAKESNRAKVKLLFYVMVFFYIVVCFASTLWKKKKI